MTNPNRDDAAAVIELRQRAEAAEALVKAGKLDHLHFLNEKLAEAQRRIEAAERELEGLKHVRCPHCAKMALQAAAMGAKLAEAQQREAWWRELINIECWRRLGDGIAPEIGRYAELRRLLGLGDAPEGK